MTAKQRFSSVWDAIEDTPQQAASMRARSELMMNLTEVIRERGMSPTVKVSKPKIVRQKRTKRAGTPELAAP